MILIFSVYLINFLVLIFTLRFNGYNSYIISITQTISLLATYIYLLIKKKREYINIKELLMFFFMSVIQFTMFLVLNKYDIIVMPKGLDGAVQTLFIIVFFFMLNVMYLLLLLITNLIKFLIVKFKE